MLAPHAALLQCAEQPHDPAVGRLPQRSSAAAYASARDSWSPLKLTGLNCVTTLLDKTVKREVRVHGRSYIVSLSPLTLKLTPKGKRKGLELAWAELVSGDAALAAALNASVARLTPDTPRPSSPRQPGRRKPRP